MPIFSVAQPSVERDEQLRLVADRLELSEHLLAPLMARGHEAAMHRKGDEGVGRAAMRGERWERIFLAMCVSSGELGREYLGRLTNEHLSSDVLRRARVWTLEHFESPTRGLPQEDDQLAQAVSEIVVRAAGQPATEHALEVGFMGLERRRLERAIKIAAEQQDFERQRELSLLRNEATEKIAELMSAEGFDSEPLEPSGSGGRAGIEGR
jgi:hypothetical protein